MTTQPEAIRLAREALIWLHDMAAGSRSIDHLYDGDCPDQLDRARRDPACPACKAMDKAAAAIAALNALPAGGEPVATVESCGIARRTDQRPRTTQSEACTHARTSGMWMGGKLETWCHECARFPPAQPAAQRDGWQARDRSELEPGAVDLMNPRGVRVVLLPTHRDSHSQMLYELARAMLSAAPKE